MVRFPTNHANVQHIDLKVPFIGRGVISEDLKSISVSQIQYITCLVHLPCPSLNLYRPLESNLGEMQNVSCFQAIRENNDCVFNGVSAFSNFQQGFFFTDSPIDFAHITKPSIWLEKIALV